MLLFIRNPIPPPSDTLFFRVHVYPLILTFSLSYRLVSVIANMSHCASNRISLMLFVLDLIPLALEYIIHNIFQVCCLFDLLVCFFFWFLLFYDVAVEIICVSVLIMVVCNISLIESCLSNWISCSFSSTCWLLICVCFLLEVKFFGGAVVLGNASCYFD